MSQNAKNQNAGIESALRAGAEGLAAGATEAAGRLVDVAGDEGLVDVAVGTLDTPVGRLVLAATPRGLVRLALPGPSLDQVAEELAVAVSPRVLEWPRRLDTVRRELDEYFAGRRRRFELPLDWRLTSGSFARRVLRATYRVPFGGTLSYGQVAARAGNPRAYRAAGSALGGNHIPIVVPCHRILRAGGDVGHYGGGSEMKRFLLRLEGALE